ncbi:MAG: PadR family transcriptional regulator [bacterium]|nr:PadR family transcriptional regulator [bacterium]
MKGNYLGEFEELVLLTVASLGAEAYAVTVKKEIEQHRKVNISAIHSSLYRLEDKGFLSSEFGGAANKRGGKKKRYFKVTSAGFSELQRSKDLRQQYWENIPQLTFSTI